MNAENSPSPAPHTDAAAEATAPVAEAAGTTSHDIPLPAGLATAMAENWEPAPAMPHPASRSGEPAAGAATFARNRAALSAAFGGQLVVVPAGVLKVRSNDTDYGFRAWSAFSWLTGESVEGAVLVLAPEGTGPGSGHTAALYLREYEGAGQPGYFTNRLCGALWVGNVPSVADSASVLGIATRPLSELGRDLQAHRGRPALAPRGIDPAVESLLPSAAPGRLAEVIDELRLVKDDWEIGQLQAACDATARGFADVAAELPAVLASGGRRGERWLEGTFWRRARTSGNDVGYGSIVACGQHATTLHWVRDDGPVRDGDLVLLDMGVESRELYTADVTRTLPVSGHFSEPQRRVYDAVRAAQVAALAAVRPGADYLAPHQAAMRVLTETLVSWGLLSGAIDELLTDQLHRRWTLHSTSHHLGLDVHDCARAREERYKKGTLEAGMVITVEPGLYVQPDDELAPAELRGIGVRIEDDVLVTSDGCRVLSAALPTAAVEVEAWMAGLLHP